MSRKLSPKTLLGIAVLLYLIDLFGDSYYGLAQKVPALHQFYQWIFSICSYTRNGIFYAPIFLLLGAMIAQQKARPNVRACQTGFVVSMALMIVEGLLLHHFKLQRHTSMYLFLLPCMYYLFHLLLYVKGRSYPGLRDLSMWVYILHPLGIVIVRGAAKLIGLTQTLVDNSLIHYTAVCVCSILGAAILMKLIKHVEGHHVSKSQGLD